ncbi:MAG: hypothetical protein ACP5TE_05285 [Verrucomicrobiia bacterium]|jgi:hypothetical protein
MKTKLAVALLLVFINSIYPQNIVDNDEIDLKLQPINLTERDFDKIILLSPQKSRFNPSGEALRIQKKLESHIVNLIENWQLMPFHHTLGISGYEVYYNHPDELFYCLSISLPYLSQNTSNRVVKFLNDQVVVLPPYAIEGYDNRTGKPRESYDVPFNLRIPGRGKARSAFGVYAFWAWCHFTEDYTAAKTHYNAIKARIKPLLEKEYKFDIYKTDYSNDEAEILNGDLAGIIGFTRLAIINKDLESANQARKIGTLLLNLRVNLERVNPKILTKTTATKSLHIFKLARYCDLTPEIAEALRIYCDGCAEKRINAFRVARNGWFIAFGDRLVGGENYTNPLHFGRALFCGAALVEKLSAQTLGTFVDVPHCIGDLYFIEKCAIVLQSFSLNTD